jgi:hypothetical protein
LTINRIEKNRRERKRKKGQCPRNERTLFMCEKYIINLAGVTEPWRCKWWVEIGKWLYKIYKIMRYTWDMSELHGLLNNRVTPGDGNYTIPCFALSTEIVEFI